MWTILPKFQVPLGRPPLWKILPKLLLLGKKRKVLRTINRFWREWVLPIVFLKISAITAVFFIRIWIITNRGHSISSMNLPMATGHERLFQKTLYFGKAMPISV